jgi:prepilin-type N-terminal cleavage/methylation domain-containing protein
MTSNRTLTKGRHRRTGFTMVELLTVIGIIVILIAILLPVVAKVRLQVRVATTQQEMNKIAGAIDQYYLEFNHSYPGPVSNAAITNKTNLPVANMTMTENMVLGLCGGLEYSTSGTPTYNSNDIVSSLGPLNLNPNVSKQTRHVAFIDSTPGQQMPDLGWDSNTSPAGTNGQQGISDSLIPEFMDKFNSYNGGQARPILYLRARVGNPVNAGNTSTATISGSDDKTTQYNYNHLLPYVNSAIGDFYGFPGGSPTDRGDQDFPVGSTTANPNYISGAAPYWVKGTTTGTNAGTTTWDTYLGNPNQFTSPRGVNAYILISAGPDGIFGTQDDIFYP